MSNVIDMKQEMSTTTIERHIKEGLEFGLSQFSDVEGNYPSYEQLHGNEEYRPVLATVHAIMSGWIAAKGVVQEQPLNSDTLLRISKGESLH